MLETKEVLSLLAKAEITRQTLKKTTDAKMNLSVTNLTEFCNNTIRLCNTIMELKKKQEKQETIIKAMQRLP